MTLRWMPLGTYAVSQDPAPGQLIARDHAVWRITKVVDQPLSDADRDVWLDAGMPDLDAWRGRPQRVHVEFVAGARPGWARDDGTVPPAQTDIPASQYRQPQWATYPPSGRWPMCSCCGEPMPCRAELEDREVTKSLGDVEKHAKKTPGGCWACDEPVTTRQKAVTYDGENLDLPGAPTPRFHTREKCGYWAREYELRWIAQDPRRERVLTYPKCPGILSVHGDGSTECRSGRTPLGNEVESEPDCRGHLTHDHGVQVSCYVGDDFLGSPADYPGCPRGCDPKTHGGTGGQSRRPARRQLAATTLDAITAPPTTGGHR